MNADTVIAALESRIADLERGASRQRRLFVGAAALLLLLVVSGQVASSRPVSVIEAERLDIKDRRGRVIGSFGSLEGGTLGLFFEGGDAGRIDLGLNSSLRSDFRIKNKWGSLSYGSVGPFIYSESASTSFTVSGTKKNGAMDYRSYEGGSSLTLMRDSNFLDSLGKSDKEWVQAKIKSTAADLLVRPDGTTALRVCDKDGNYRAIIGSLELVNPKTGIKTARPPGSLCILGEDGKEVWSAP